MPFSKNEFVIAEITDISTGGEGIAKVDGYTLFIKDALPGDTIKAKITKPLAKYGYARVEEIITPSPYRTEPVCPVSRQCGGCQLQALSYERQLAFKEQLVRNNLIHIAGMSAEEVDTVIRPAAGADRIYGYRNKLQIPVQQDPQTGRAIAGFYAGRTHHIIPLSNIPGGECAVSMPAMNRIPEIILRFMNERKIPAYDEKTGKGTVRHILIRAGFHTGEISVCIVNAAKKLPQEDELIRLLTEENAPEGIVSISMNYNPAPGNVILGKSIRYLYGKDSIDDLLYERQDITGAVCGETAGMRYAISPMSFYQVNPLQTEKLYSYVMRFASLTGSETVWDLYCGAGTISLFLARKARKIYGIEIVPEAVEDAKRNASVNHIYNAEFFCGAAEELLPKSFHAGSDAGSHTDSAVFSNPVDVVVVDPPRKGLDRSCVDTILSASPSRIIYVSCDSATLSRDIALFRAGGYNPEVIQPVDMFPQTVHIETVVLISKGNISSEKIRVEFNLEDMDMSGFRQGATYEEIHEWVQEKYGFHVTHLNIAQVKRKHGIIERENYNKPKGTDSRQPGCPEEKITAIEEALKHFKMI